jgi:hypothetical protein
MKSYTAYSIDADGKTTKIVAESIVIELAEDKSVELILNPHPNHFGGLPILTPANVGEFVEHNTNTHSVFNIKPGASNVVHLHVENIEIKE